MFFKTEDENPGINKAVSDKLTEGYVITDKNIQKTNEAVEGAGAFKLNNSEEWILMYDVYKNGKYQFTRSKDLRNFTVIDHTISMNFRPRHGTVMQITSKEAEALTNMWGTADDVIQSPQSKGK